LTTKIFKNILKGSISWECLPFASKKSKQNLKTKKSKKGKVNESESNQGVTTISSSKQHKPEGAVETHPERQKPPPPPLPRTDSLNMDLKTDRELNNILLENSRQLKEQKLKHFGSSTSTTITTSSTVQSSSLQATTITGNKLTKKQLAQSEQKINVETTKPQKHHPYSTSLVNSGFGFGFDLEGGEADNQLTFIVNVKPNGDAARKGLSDGKHTSLFLIFWINS
jgi:hypothetical protein